MIKMLQLLCYNFYMTNTSFVLEKKIVSDKTWQNMLHDKTILSQTNQLINLWMIASEFPTEMLIFRRSRSQIFFKIGVLENFAILESLFLIKLHVLQNKYGGCFLIFATANNFLLLNMVFIADSRTSFCSRLI